MDILRGTDHMAWLPASCTTVDRAVARHRAGLPMPALLMDVHRGDDDEVAQLVDHVRRVTPAGFTITLTDSRTPARPGTVPTAQLDPAHRISRQVLADYMAGQITTPDEGTVLANAYAAVLDVDEGQAAQ